MVLVPIVCCFKRTDFAVARPNSTHLSGLEISRVLHRRRKGQKWAPGLIQYKKTKLQKLGSNKGGIESQGCSNLCSQIIAKLTPFLCVLLGASLLVGSCAGSHGHVIGLRP